MNIALNVPRNRIAGMRPEIECNRVEQKHKSKNIAVKYYICLFVYSLALNIIQYTHHHPRDPISPNGTVLGKFKRLTLTARRGNNWRRNYRLISRLISLRREIVLWSSACNIYILLSLYLRLLFHISVSRRRAAAVASCDCSSTCAHTHSNNTNGDC